MRGKDKIILSYITLHNYTENIIIHEGQLGKQLEKIKNRLCRIQLRRIRDFAPT